MADSIMAEECLLIVFCAGALDSPILCSLLTDC